MDLTMHSFAYTFECVSPELRTKNFILRMSELEMNMLSMLADKAGLSSADVVRQCIRREYTEKFGTFAPVAAKKKPPKRPKK